VGDNQNSLALGPRGPVVFEDILLFEKMPHFNRRFDLTKVWPHKDSPLLEVGELVLDRNPVNYFAEVEQTAFEPRNIVPGMGFSPDKMLHVRLFSYPDAHRYRLGVNYDTRPVNKPQCAVHTYNRDGFMRFDENSGSEVNYEPNGFNGPTEDPAYRERPRTITGSVDHHNDRLDGDYYVQPGNPFRLMAPGARERLIGTIVGQHAVGAAAYSGAANRAFL
jgi:catalase